MGRFFVFVDEAHRSQGGKFHDALKSVLPDALFVGFTGTPLLETDAASVGVFGGYIHTYKLNEAVKDGVILDLTYEARDIDQRLGSPERVDVYFAAKTKSLNSWQRNELEKRWATKQKVLSSKSRMEKIVADITFDFETRERLLSGLGNAILVAASIYDACRYFQLFQATELRDKCAIVTSYDPKVADIKLEETGASSDTEKQFIYKMYEELLKSVAPQGGKSKTETYEDNSKALFINEPANMRLLIVVQKLLTGFDAPACSVIYIDKHMENHGLFQAICRTNRLDDETKMAGNIIDYKRLFDEVSGAIAVYTAELDHTAPGETPEVIIHTRIERAKERIHDALETLDRLEEQVNLPRLELNFQHYFCGNTEIETDLEATSARREALYRGVVALVRAVSEISDSWSASGYEESQIEHILKRRDHFVHVRNFVRRSSGEELDLKPYEADMRRLIDMYIEADPSRELFTTDDMGLLELLDRIGAEKTVDKIEEGIDAGSIADHEVAAEMIENNIRKKIVKSKLSDPVYFETMSALLNQVIADRKAGAIEYEQYLRAIDQIAKKAREGRLDDTPRELDTPGKRSLWNSLGKNEAAALQVHHAVIENRPDAWRGNLAKEMEIKRAIYEALKSSGLPPDASEVERLFSIVREQAEYA